MVHLGATPRPPCLLCLQLCPKSPAQGLHLDGFQEMDGACVLLDGACVLLGPDERAVWCGVHPGSSAVWRGVCSGFQFPYAHHFGTHQLKKEVVILGHLCPSEESTSEAELTSIRVGVPDFGMPLFPRMLF